jgi:branched-subunit amino acid aminotransferase/4-amino-4-deoxychorismate lyase
MRGWLLERIPELGLKTEEADITEADLIAADEVWLSNSVAGVRRVGEVGGRRWQDWPVFELIERLGLPAPGWPRPVETQINPRESSV